MMQSKRLLETEASWARAASRAPALAAGRLLMRMVLLLFTVPGAMHLWLLVRWSWNLGQHGLLMQIALHAVALVLAIGLPVRRSAMVDDPSMFVRFLHVRLTDRAGRLSALARAITIEVIVLFIVPPIMTVMAGDLPRWPASFVVAVAACSVVWPLERIAVAQRNEARRLSASS